MGLHRRTRPDDATADYLHQVFAPTAQAIDGLEKALAGLGLLDQALDLDLRRPQDHYHRLWNLSFRAADLAAASDAQQEGAECVPPCRRPPQPTKPGASAPNRNYATSPTPLASSSGASSW